MHVRTRIQRPYRQRLVAVFALLTALIVTLQTTASADVASPAVGGGATTVKILEGPLRADHASVEKSLIAGRDPASLGLHAPTSKDISKYTQKDVDALTNSIPPP
jgi:hypothetical protein